MPARQAVLRDAVADFIEAGSFPYPFDVIRTNIPYEALEETNTTRLFVYPGGRSFSSEVRIKTRKAPAINLELLNFLDTETLDEQDRAIHLMELIQEYLFDQVVAGFSFESFLDEDNPREIYDVRQIGNSNYFRAVMTATYYEIT